MCCSLSFSVMDIQQDPLLLQQVNVDLPGDDEEAVAAKFSQYYEQYADHVQTELVVDASIYKKRGIVIQFVNTNTSGSSSMIGGIRLAIDDIRKVPRHLMTHYDSIRNYGVVLLGKHLTSTNCNVGVLEALSNEDYGLTFTVASLSSLGKRLNPNRRNEGPLFYCAYEGLVEPMFLNQVAENLVDQAYFFNAYIYLLPHYQRRTLSLRHAHEGLPQSVDPNPPKKQRMGTFVPPPRAPYQQGGYSRDSREQRGPPADQLKLQDQVVTLQKEMKKMQSQAIPTPPLPKTKPLQWPPTSRYALPDDL
jgi:hypothetical protein